MSIHTRVSVSSTRRQKSSIKISDIKITNLSSLPTPPFELGFSFCSGALHDLGLQKLTAYGRIIDEYIDYFTRLKSAEMDLAHVYARLTDAFTSPLPELDLFLPSSHAGIYASITATKQYQQNVVDLHFKLSNYIKQNVLPSLKNLKTFVQTATKSYKVSIGSVSGQIAAFDLLLSKNFSQLQSVSLIPDLHNMSSSDPLFQVLEIYKLVKKKSSVQDQQASVIKDTLVNLRSFETELLSTLRDLFLSYLKFCSELSSLQSNSFILDQKNFEAIVPSSEFSFFTEKFQRIIYPQDIFPCSSFQNPSVSNNNSIASLNSSSSLQTGDIFSSKLLENLCFLDSTFKIIKEGGIAIQERSGLFKKSYHRANMVLTSTGYLHIYLQKSSSINPSFISSLPPTSHPQFSSLVKNTSASFDINCPSKIISTFPLPANGETNYHRPLTSYSQKKKQYSSSSSPKKCLSQHENPKPRLTNIQLEKDIGNNSNCKMSIYSSAPLNSITERQKKISIEGRTLVPSNLTQPSPPISNYNEHSNIKNSVNSERSNINGSEKEDVYSEHNVDTDQETDDNITPKSFNDQDSKHTRTLATSLPPPSFLSAEPSAPYISHPTSYENYPFLKTSQNNDQNQDTNPILKSSTNPNSSHIKSLSKKTPTDSQSFLFHSQNSETCFLQSSQQKSNPCINQKINTKKTTATDDKISASSKPSHITTESDILPLKNNSPSLNAVLQPYISKLESLKDPNYTFFIPQTKYKTMGFSHLVLQSKDHKLVLFDSEADIASWYSVIHNFVPLSKSTKP
ncbi:hypothetical protein BB560_001622 [Smittium megazygosporum]|uniref:PH domain-containing protein n=1 Tax=Smittium megazygosporum TaxID=133381 RepID=A0A2T9ZH38_9FUNG|nr:hypothetical protein BB560_001622 [Smittium megazygosporum]